MTPIESEKENKWIATVCDHFAHSASIWKRVIGSLRHRWDVIRVSDASSRLGPLQVLSLAFNSFSFFFQKSRQPSPGDLTSIANDFQFDLISKWIIHHFLYYFSNGIRPFRQVLIIDNSHSARALIDDFDFFSFFFDFWFFEVYASSCLKQFPENPDCIRAFSTHSVENNENKSRFSPIHKFHPLLSKGESLHIVACANSCRICHLTLIQLVKFDFLNDV